MAFNHKDREAARRYLLGRVAEEGELRRVEERLLTDDEFFAELRLAQDELADEYVAGDLDEEERAAFERHFLTTPARRRKVEFARRLRRHVAVSKTRAGEAPAGAPAADPARARGSWPWALKAAAAVLVIVGLGLAARQFFSRPSEVEEGLVALRSLYRERRPVESRISDFDYAPWSNTRGGGQEPAGDTLQRERAERLLLDAAHASPGRDTRHALGVLYLSRGEFDKAVAQFEEALKAAPDDARLHADLGAALLEQGKARRQRGEDGEAVASFAASLTHLSRALELDANLLPALFNRAILYQNMYLPNQARADWNSYLDKEKDSGWAEEARRQLRALDEQGAGASRPREQLLTDFLRAYEARDEEAAWEVISRNREGLTSRAVTEQLVDAYLDAAAGGRREEAAHDLRALAYAGELEGSRGGEHYASEVARFYAGQTPARLPALARARALLKSGHEHYTRGEMAAAIASYESARQAFDGAGDRPEARLAEFWAGYPVARAGTDGARDGFKRLAAESRARGYRWLLMRTLLAISVIDANLNDYSEAIARAREALGEAERLDDSLGVFNALSHLVEYYRTLGNYDEALAYVQRSLPYVVSCPLNAIQVWRHYSIVASALNSAGLSAAAAGYQSESVRRALEMGEFSDICISYAHLGLIYARAGAADEALRAGRLAYETARQRADTPTGREMMAYASLQLGHIYRAQGDYRQAVASYDESVAAFHDMELPAQLYQAYKGRLFCRIARGEDALAAVDLEVALGLIEKYRSAIREGDNRNSFFENEQSVYDLAIDFEQTHRGDARRAFDYSEASRARSLLDLMNEGGSVRQEGGRPDVVFGPEVFRPLPLERVREGLPAGARLLQYAVLPDKVLVWVVSRDDFRWAESRVAQEELNDKVRAYLRAVSSDSADGEADEERAAADLYDLLVRPALPFLGGAGGELLVAPDKVLSYLPFAALFERESKRRLVEDHPLVYVPSATVLAVSTEAAARRGGSSGEPESFFGVGNPLFDPAQFPSLQDLPAAAREARASASFYGGSPVLLTGAAATKARVLAGLAQADVAHLALHSVVDERSPMRSRLVLARAGTDDDGGGGALEAQELYRLRLPRTRLVVLSACQTGVERYYGGEGMLNIARPFLAAGAPLVVASFWPVESDSTAELMVDFHRRRKQEGVPTAEALRRAQLGLLRGDDARLRRPHHWAAFGAIGGHADF